MQLEEQYKHMHGFVRPVELHVHMNKIPLESLRLLSNRSCLL